MRTSRFREFAFLVALSLLGCGGSGGFQFDGGSDSDRKIPPNYPESAGNPEPPSDVFVIPPEHKPRVGRFTIEVLATFNSVGEFNPLLHDNVADEWTQADGYSLKYESGKFYCRYAVASNLAYALSVPYEVKLGEAMHVGCTFDGQMFRLYVEGKKVAQRASGRPIYYGDHSLIVGAGYHSRRGGFGRLDGQVNQIRIWNFARPDDEIERDALVMLSGDEQGMVAFWSFGDGSVPLIEKLKL